MLARTHLAITICFILIFISYVENKFIFVIIALLATLVPDLDSKNSKLGRKKIIRPLQFFIKHRGIVHSFTFLFLVTILLVLYLPVVAFPFFMAYSLHLISDSFTIHGVRPFYPSTRQISGMVKTGGRFETSIFTLFVLVDLFLFVFQAPNFF